MVVKKNSKQESPVIRVCKNGPYVVDGKVEISEMSIGTDKDGISDKWIKGEKMPETETCSLCRCGKSRNKPFCDGSHVPTKFEGKETAPTKGIFNNANKIEGPTLKMSDAEELCAYARFCDREGGIWDLVRNSNDTNSRKTAIQEAEDCPAGRFVIFDKKSGKVLEPKFDKSIGVVDDPTAGVEGPLWVRGGIPVESSDGKRYEVRKSMALCRCGKSRNKPFCDASHMK
jgi:CDGSH-type Zn-finger protein